jgi:putative hydrolase of the HAD superfamily
MQRARITNDIRAVVFDLFGTVVPGFSFKQHEQAVTATAKILKVDEENFRQLWLQSYDDRVTGVYKDTESNILAVCNRLAHPTDRDLLLRAALPLREFTRSSVTASHITLSLLNQLRRNGLRNGLVSNCAPEVPRLWVETNLVNAFDAMCFSCNVGRAKPDPEIYLQVCEALSVRPEECLYVGDGSQNELTGARVLGMRSVLLKCETSDTYDAVRPDVEKWCGESIDSLDELRGFVGLDNVRG